jgi:glycosyltransferase involved in cell wall biosynthesis
LSATAVDESPLVTIITPSFNQARFLPATLESVAYQSYGAIEHIVLDGGSTDGSADIIRSWAETHDVVWRSAPDGGQADAIVQGAAMAHGEIIAWLNSDDVYLDSEVVADVVEAFGSGADMVTGGGWYLDEQGGRVEQIPVFPERIDFETLKHVDWVLQPATFVRRDLFLRCPIDTSLHYAFDWDLFIRLARIGTFIPIFRELAGYTRHETGKTISGGGRRQRELLEVTRRHNGRLSRAYFLLVPVVGAHLVAQRLPAIFQRPIVTILTWFAAASQRWTHGRGIQY